MYTVKIDISDWSNDEFLTIETGDFDKVQIIQEFIEFQKEHGWAVDYEATVYDEEDAPAEDELAEDEELVDEQTGGDVYIFNISNAKEDVE
jgi:hypothetical protein